MAGAYYLCGSVPPFVALMNQRAQQIGALHTHFVTPNGLYAPGHYSTASDLALLAMALILVLLYAVIHTPSAAVYLCARRNHPRLPIEG